MRWHYYWVVDDEVWSPLRPLFSIFIPYSLTYIAYWNGIHGNDYCHGHWTHTTTVYRTRSIIICDLTLCSVKYIHIETYVFLSQFLVYCSSFNFPKNNTYRRHSKFKSIKILFTPRKPYIMYIKCDNKINLSIYLLSNATQRESIL